MSDTPMADAAEREGNKQITLLGNLRVVLERFRQMELSRQPSDMVLVPREPTAKMISAAFSLRWDDGKPGSGSGDLGEIWKAMLAAAGKEKS